MSDRAPAGPPTAEDLPAVIEALLFVAEEPQTAGALARAAGVGEAAVRKALQRLAAACEAESRGLRLQEDGHRYQLVTAPDWAPYVGALLGAGPTPKLSKAALETLTVIAYRQPCTRAEIEAVRGVNSDRLVASLEQRGLVDEAGQANAPGRPRLYRTTIKFLEHFGIQSPSELPPLPAPEPDGSVAM